jgi:hypothetical protein
MARLISAAMTVSVLYLASIANAAVDIAQDPTDSHVATTVISTIGARELKASGERLRQELNMVYKELYSHSQEIPNYPDSRDISEL